MEPLLPEAKNDLRRRVLEGYRLTIEEAAAVIASARGARKFAAESAASAAKKPSSRKKAMSDEELDADLDLFINRSQNGKPSTAASPADTAPELDLS